MNQRIKKLHARRLWDSRGRPTVEAEIVLTNGRYGRAIAPAGASTGSAEAVDKRDAGDAHGGLDVRQALSGIETIIAPALEGMPIDDQLAIDNRLIDLDGTAQKSRLGGNALVAVSMAACHAGAAAHGVPLWQYLAADKAIENLRLPLPEIQIFGGGAHAGRRVDVQDFMVIATGAESFAQALDWTAEVYLAAGQLMASRGLLQGVADEGGFWPAFDTNEQALDTLVQAIEQAGFRPGEQMAISLDIAATDFGGAGRHTLAREAREVGAEELSEMLLGWLRRYPVVAIEDPLAEDDSPGLAAFTSAAGPRIEVVADDFICTNATRIETAAAAGACNTALIKPNQAGTLSETFAAYNAARNAGWQSLISARSGETEDVTIVHLAVGWQAKQLKVGSFARSERMAKWNEGLRIAEALGQKDGPLPEHHEFPWGA